MEAPFKEVNLKVFLGSASLKRRQYFMNPWTSSITWWNIFYMASSKRPKSAIPHQTC